MITRNDFYFENNNQNDYVSTENLKELNIDEFTNNTSSNQIESLIETALVC